jgi:hypothetical protein
VSAAAALLQAEGAATEPLVYRQVALPVSAFDYIKHFQREHEARHGVRLTNSQVLTAIIRQFAKAERA